MTQAQAYTTMTATLPSTGYLTLQEPLAIQLSRHSSLLHRNKSTSRRSKRCLLGGLFHRHTADKIPVETHKQVVNIAASFESFDFDSSNVYDENTYSSCPLSECSANSDFEEDHFVNLSVGFKRRRSNTIFHDWVQTLQRSPKKKPRRHHFSWFASSSNPRFTSSPPTRGSQLTALHHKQIPMLNALPEEAISCYKQFKIADSDLVFSSNGAAPLVSGSTEIKADDIITNAPGVSIPQYSPLHVLSFENLEALRQQIFTIPGFSFSAEDFTGSDLGPHATTHSRASFTLSSVSSETSEESSQHTGEFEDKTPKVVEELFIETNKDSTPPQSLHESSVLGSPLEQAVSKEKTIAEFLYDGLLRTGAWSEDELKDFGKGPDTPQISNEIELTGEQNLSDHSSSESQMLEYCKTPTSVLDKMKSVIWGSYRSSSLNEESSAEDDSSNYSPCTILVPTVREEMLLTNLTGDILEDRAIEQIYHPSDNYGDQDDDENTPFDIRDPSFFAATSSKKGIEQQQSNLKIRFVSFSRVLFYNGSGSLHQSRLKFMTELHSLRMELFKVQGTLNLKSPTTSDVHNRLSFTDPVQSITERMSRIASVPKPILKSKVNKNVGHESMRIVESDQKDIRDFMEEFRHKERERLESTQYFDDEREKQLSIYYSDP